MGKEQQHKLITLESFDFIYMDLKEVMEIVITQMSKVSMKIIEGSQTT